MQHFLSLVCDNFRLLWSQYQRSLSWILEQVHQLHRKDYKVFNDFNLNFNFLKGCLPDRASELLLDEHFDGEIRTKEDNVSWNDRQRHILHPFGIHSRFNAEDNFLYHREDVNNDLIFMPLYLHDRSISNQFEASFLQHLFRGWKNWINSDSFNADPCSKRCKQFTFDNIFRPFIELGDSSMHTSWN